MADIFHASLGENGSITGGAVGDQTGKEVCIRSWYSKPWNKVLRYKDSTVAKKVSEIGKKLAKSNLVGYDQSNRNSLYAQLKKNGFDVDKYIKSGVKTETDCSAFQYACWCCVVSSMRADGNAPTTSTWASFGLKHGFSIFKDSAHLTSSAKLIDGDICLSEGHHVVGVCNVGNSTTTTTTKTTTSTSTSSSYSKGSRVSVKGTLYANADGSGKKITVNSKLYIVQIEKSYKYPYAFSHTKGGARLGWGKKADIQ